MGNIKFAYLYRDGGNYKNLPLSLQKTRNVNIAWTRLNSKKPSFTIDTGHRHHFHYKYNRIPTVRESARIQSFPDNFVFLNSTSDAYRQIGNAVAPVFGWHLARAVTNTLQSFNIEMNVYKKPKLNKPIFVQQNLLLPV